MNTFIFTCGDINGIGPEVAVKTLKKVVPKSNAKFIFICPEAIFHRQIKQHILNFDYEIINSQCYSTDLPLTIIDLGRVKSKIGYPTRESGLTAFKAIELALFISNQNNNIAIVTAPISKKALVLAKINYRGHTEILADKLRVNDFAMMFLSKTMKAALATIHVPLKDVPKLISKKMLSNKITLLVKTLKKDFKITNPKIAVLGLNPHSGEDGLLGNEENKIIIPFIKEHSENKLIAGPFPSDAFWGMHLYKKFDLILGMYHDQVLAPFKLLNFDRGVNFTAGLPIVRTSPDHGTAFDIAGKGIANESSMVEAYKFAKRILSNRSQ
jgi:4-hydroxythreonine-4-phosphate dehydrogenase